MKLQPFGWVLIEKDHRIDMFLMNCDHLLGFEFHVKTFLVISRSVAKSLPHMMKSHSLLLFHASCGFVLLTDSHFTPDLLHGGPWSQHIQLSSCVQVSWLTQIVSLWQVREGVCAKTTDSDLPLSQRPLLEMVQLLWAAALSSSSISHV